MLTQAVGTLLSCRHFPKEDYEALITKVAQYANKVSSRLHAEVSLTMPPPAAEEARPVPHGEPVLAPVLAPPTARQCSGCR